MLTLDTLYREFKAARQRQATINGRAVTDFDEKVGQVLFKAAWKAIEADPLPATFKVCAAPTGSGKSQSSAAMAAAPLAADRSGRRCPRAG